MFNADENLYFVLENESYKLKAMAVTLPLHYKHVFHCNVEIAYNCHE